MWRSETQVSKSMVALLVSLCGALLIGMLGWVPSLLGRDSGVRSVQPGLLTVDPAAAGVITLGEGRAVGLDGNGLRLVHGTDVLFRSVRMGSPVSVMTGEVTGTGGKREEEVDTIASNLHVTAVAVRPGSATYVAVAVEGERRTPVTIEVRLDGDWLRMDITAKGADAVILHGAEEPGTRGLSGVLPTRSLHQRAWWLPSDASGTRPAYLSGLGTTMALAPDNVHRAVDLRRRGLTDLHVWSGTATVRVSSWARFKGTS